MMIDYRFLSKKNTNELREIAVQLGADRKRLYGTSKQALITIIWHLSNPIVEFDNDDKAEQ